jgi:hypothetical protein
MGSLVIGINAAPVAVLGSPSLADVGNLLFSSLPFFTSLLGLFGKSIALFHSNFSDFDSSTRNRLIVPY